MKTFLKASFALTLIASQAYAYNPILRPFHSVRAAGMGDVRYTTGLFEENFYANPARITRNPGDMFQMPKLSFEAGSGTLNTLSSLTSSNSGDGLSKVANSVGKPLSFRTQMVFPAYYNKEFLASFWSFGFALTTSFQTIASVGQNSLIEPMGVFDVGPAFTIARKLLEDNVLSVGTTVHALARGTSRSFGVKDFLTGTNIGRSLRGGSSLGYDFDLGVSFKPHWNLGGLEYEVDAAVNNILGGQYTNVKKDLITGWDNENPTPLNRSYNLGVSATHHHWFFFDSVTIALEATDIGNNQNGSFYRNLHMGSEWTWKTISLRGGVNQGYIAGGFGLDLRFFDLNLATYGEELGLNAGTVQDRRYALEFGFEIQ